MYTYRLQIYWLGFQDSFNMTNLLGEFLVLVEITSQLRVVKNSIIIEMVYD